MKSFKNDNLYPSHWQIIFNSTIVQTLTSTVWKLIGVTFYSINSAVHNSNTAIKETTTPLERNI